MNKTSAEQLSDLLGTDTLELLITTGGIVTRRLNGAGKTITQFDDLEPEATAAARGLAAHMLGLHENSADTSQKEADAKQLSALLKIVEDAGVDDAKIRAVKQAFAAVGRDIDAARAKEAAAAVVAEEAVSLKE